jgi:hypothetical protein
LVAEVLSDPVVISKHKDFHGWLMIVTETLRSRHKPFASVC